MLDLKSGLSAHFSIVYFGKEKSAHHHIWTSWKEELAPEVLSIQAAGAAVRAAVSSSVCRGAKFMFL